MILLMTWIGFDRYNTGLIFAALFAAICLLIVVYNQSKPKKEPVQPEVNEVKQEVETPKEKLDRECSVVEEVIENLQIPNPEPETIEPLLLEPTATEPTQPDTTIPETQPVQEEPVQPKKHRRKRRHKRRTKPLPETAQEPTPELQPAALEFSTSPQEPALEGLPQ